MTTQRLKWIEGTPEDSGGVGWFFIVNESDDRSVVEVEFDGDGNICRCPRGFGEIVAYAGPIEEPDESTMP